MFIFGQYIDLVSDFGQFGGWYVNGLLLFVILLLISVIRVKMGDFWGVRALLDWRGFAEFVTFFS